VAKAEGIKNLISWQSTKNAIGMTQPDQQSIFNQKMIGFVSISEPISGTAIQPFGLQ
jgi:hypothetical protein